MPTGVVGGGKSFLVAIPCVHASLQINIPWIYGTRFDGFYMCLMVKIRNTCKLFLHNVTEYMCLIIELVTLASCSFVMIQTVHNNP